MLNPKSTYLRNKKNISIETRINQKVPATDTDMLLL